LLPEVPGEMKEKKVLKDMTKMKEREEATEVEAMEKEGIAGSGIMNGINDVKEKSIGYGIEHAKVLRSAAASSIMNSVR
jgi:hypothetical protein